MRGNTRRRTRWGERIGNENGQMEDVSGMRRGRTSAAGVGLKAIDDDLLNLHGSPPDALRLIPRLLANPFGSSMQVGVARRPWKRLILDWFEGEGALSSKIPTSSG